MPIYVKVKFIDPRKDSGDEMFDKVFVRDGEKFVLHLHKFVLASIKEYVRLDHWHICILESRNSFARRGIIPHVQAGIGELGWEGQYTLEIVNLNEVPVILRPGDKIAQIFSQNYRARVRSLITRKKSAKYQTQRGPTGSRLFQEF